MSHPILKLLFWGSLAAGTVVTLNSQLKQGPLPPDKELEKAAEEQRILSERKPYTWHRLICVLGCIGIVMGLCILAGA